MMDAYNIEKPGKNNTFGIAMMSTVRENTRFLASKTKDEKAIDDKNTVINEAKIKKNT